MALRNSSDVNKVVAEYGGNRDEIALHIDMEVEADPEIALRLCDKVQPFLSVDSIRRAMEIVMSGDHPERYLPYLKSVQNFFPDEELRERLVKVHHSHPWMFYSHSGNLKELFPNEYFRRLMDQGVDIFANPDLLRIFQLYNAQMPILSYNAKIRDRLRLLLETQEQADVFIEAPKEPGFACGGMEKNYRQGARTQQGLCLVNNGLLLAKYFHAKGDAKKVSYLARRTQETEEGYILWKDYLYAPTEGQHAFVIDALENGKHEVTIPHLMIKPVRPLIAETSEEIFTLFESKTGAA
jgi:hypothetical protein